MNDKTYYGVDDISTAYIREYAYKNGKKIYDFMNKYDIGKSNYGKIMDAAAKGKGVIAHRLYGHHLIYDFPINNPNQTPDFLEHIFSDLFTKQGIPIIPGEVLKDVGLLKICDKLKGSWDFVNGFDILAGTVAIYKGANEFRKAIGNKVSVDDFKDFANTIGVGALELAIAMSTCNPFLLVGGMLHLTAGLKGVINDGAVIYFEQTQSRLTIKFSMNIINIKKYLEVYSIDDSINNISIERSSAEIGIPYKL